MGWKKKKKKKKKKKEKEKEEKEEEEKEEEEEKWERTDIFLLPQGFELCCGKRRGGEGERSCIFL